MSAATPVKKRIRKPREDEKGAKKPSNSIAGGDLRLASAEFAYSAHDPRDMRPPKEPEVAFAGRSNAGKSSAINALAGRKRLAFASKTPGRTQLINFFTIGSRAFLVDLPGYGYAGVPGEVRAHWEGLVGTYVAERRSLVGVVVVMDARHPLTPLDRRLLDWLHPAGRRVHILLTKADKLSSQAATSTLAAVRRELAKAYPGASVQLFSSTRRAGIAEAAGVISGWVADDR